MNHKGLIGFLLGVLVGGCAHLETPGGQTSRTVEDYYPLAVGNCWNYGASFQGQAQPDLKVCIVKQDGKFFVDDKNNPSRLRFDAEGLRDGSVRYLLKGPLEVGQKWMSVASVSTVEHYQIEEVGKRVKVPAGVYKDCVVVRMEEKMVADRSIVIRTTFAPGAGIVAIRTALHIGDKQVPQISMELKNFRTKSPPAE